ncbi:MAG: TIGR02996 domain-containing protein [Planctomycetes bacterium]|nr:TIGR02996 domain-containing protein [Planctomycetota bacterium]
MADETALLGAVLREPQADAPRIAYADWLRQKGGAANLARADLIRVQIEFELCGEQDRHWPQLARLERELLTQWRATWERPFRDLLKPSLFRPARWLKARLFGQGGVWCFHRGFIEEIDTSAAGYIEEDSILFEQTPIRRVVLSNATSLIEALAADPRLDNLLSLHLVSDAEFDDEMEGLRQAATSIGLAVIELRIPRIQSDAADLLALLGSDIEESKLERLEEFRNWARASERERERLRELARRPRHVQRLTEPEHFSHAESLRLNDWVYLGDRLREAGAWAVVKTFHDLEDDAGLCRRLVLFKKEKLKQDLFDALRDSPHFHPAE